MASLPVNPHPADFRAWKRRRDTARRLPPLDTGRRDPDGRPAFDPDGRAHRAAQEHLAQVLTMPTTPPAIAHSIGVVLAALDERDAS